MELIRIRPLTATDPALMAAAFAAIGWSRPATQFERYHAEQEAGHRQVFVACLNHEFAGYATLNWEPAYEPFRKASIPEIQDLNVLPPFRRRGIGSALLNAAEAGAGSRARVAGIAVGLSSDYGAAQRLYVRRGYIPDGRGIIYRGRAVDFGEAVTADDDLVLCFTRDLRG